MEQCLNNARNSFGWTNTIQLMSEEHFWSCLILETKLSIPQQYFNRDYRRVLEGLSLSCSIKLPQKRPLTSETGPTFIITLGVAQVARSASAFLLDVRMRVPLGRAWHQILSRFFILICLTRLGSKTMREITINDRFHFDDFRSFIAKIFCRQCCPVEFVDCLEKSGLFQGLDDRFSINALNLRSG